MGVYDRSLATATKGIKKWGQLVTWRRRIAAALPDPLKPWEKAPDTIVDVPVRILFTFDDLEDRQLVHYLKNTETQRGLVNGMMQAVDFIPRTTDTVLRGDIELVIATLDVLAPGGVILYHLIEFKK